VNFPYDSNTQFYREWNSSLHLLEESLFTIIESRYFCVCFLEVELPREKKIKNEKSSSPFVVIT
jgi:hypothetical protein